MREIEIEIAMIIFIKEIIILFKIIIIFLPILLLLCIALPLTYPEKVVHIQKFLVFILPRQSLLMSLRCLNSNLVYSFFLFLSCCFSLKKLYYNKTSTIMFHLPTGALTQISMQNFFLLLISVISSSFFLIFFADIICYLWSMEYDAVISIVNQLKKERQMGEKKTLFCSFFHSL